MRFMGEFMTTVVRRRMARKAAGATLTVLVLGAGAVGCSGGDKGNKAGKADGGSPVNISPIAFLRSVEKSTDNADSARVHSSMTIGSAVSAKTDGALSWGHGLTGTLTITYTGGRTAQMMSQLGTTSMEARYLPDGYYANMGEKFAQQMGGKHWIGYAYDDFARMSGASGALMKDQMQNSTPNQSVKLLLASGDVKKVGAETVSGQHVTHYAGTVNVADMAGKTGDLSASQRAQLKKQLSQAGVSTEKLDLWINDQNLLVKSTSTANMSVGLMSQTTYYSDYGVKVTAQKPAESDTENFADLMKKVGASSGAPAAGSGITGS